jgi:hypothetical protein
MASEFEIEFVPLGWRRGDKLSLRNAPPNGRGFVALHSDCLGIYDVHPKSIAAVEFWSGEEAKINAWLKWWRANGL